MRTRTAFLMAAVFVLPSFQAAAQPGGPPNVAGAWNSTYGATNLVVNDRRDAQGRTVTKEVTGSYKGESGRLKGELRGTTFSGHWFEPNASVQCRTAREGTRYWGRVEFTFNPAGDRFDGKWGYCEEPPTSTGWSGQRGAAIADSRAMTGGQVAAAQPQAQAQAPAQGGSRFGRLGRLGASLATGAAALGGAAALPAVAGMAGVAGVAGMAGMGGMSGMAGMGATPDAGSAGAPAGGGCTGASNAGVTGALAGAIGGALLDRGLSKARIPYDYGVRSTLHGALVDKIACLLSPQERQQAAQATEQVVQRGVGATARWESRDRPGVTGTSTVASEQKQANGGICRVVNDVVIVQGEETTVQKRMCRAPGASGFTLQA